jgi:hypothetical protein
MRWRSCWLLLRWCSSQQTAPVVEPGEVAAAAAAAAGGLGDTWPAAKGLAALQVGCNVLITERGFCQFPAAL